VESPDETCFSIDRLPLESSFRLSHVIDGHSSCSLCQLASDRSCTVSDSAASRTSKPEEAENEQNSKSWRHLAKDFENSFFKKDEILTETHLQFQLTLSSAHA
jgi:hypothetical protein